MALFKIFRGNEADLDSVPKHEGYAYFTQDKGNLYIDISNEKRVQVSAYAAEILRDKLTGTEINIDDVFLKSVGGSVTGDVDIAGKLIVRNTNDDTEIRLISDDSAVKIINTSQFFGIQANNLNTQLDTQTIYFNADNEIKISSPTSNIIFEAQNMKFYDKSVPDGSSNTALPIKWGGTGAKDVATARSNLGVAAKGNCIIVHLAVDGWSGSGPYTQQVAAQGATTTNLIVPSPAPASWEAAGKAMVYCSAQAVDSLTFTCKKMPTTELSYNVLIQEVG